MTPERVLVHLASDRFTEGFFRIDGDVLVMTYSDGTDVEPAVSCHLRPTDCARSIAAVLTKEIRKRMTTPFWDDFNFPENGIA